jgi:uncharacterized protein (DUF3084 family)
MSAQDPKYELTKLERLAVLLRDDGVDPHSLSDEQVTAYLKENKVDMVEAQKRFDAIVKRAKSMQRLEQACQKRLQAAAKIDTILSVGNEALESVREKVRSMIERLKQHDPDQAQVYAREFEKATAEDLKLLEEDLMLLELEDTGDGKGD